MIRLAVLVLLVLGISTAHAGAWLQPSGKAYLRLSGGWLETDSRYDKNGKAIPFDDFGGFRETTYRDLESILYVEAGVHPNLTVLGTVMAKSIRASQSAVVYNAGGVSDAMLGLKTKLWKGLWHVGSVSAQWWFPTGYDHGLYPALGSGTQTVNLGVHAGASAGAVWANADIMYGLRETPFRDHFQGLVSGGYTLSPRLALRGSLGFQAPLGSRKGTKDVLFDPASVDARTVEAAGTLSWGLGNIALEGEVRGPLSGENTLRGVRFSLAVATNPAIRWRGTEPPPVNPWGVPTP